MTVHLQRMKMMTDLMELDDKNVKDQIRQRLSSFDFKFSTSLHSKDFRHWQFECISHFISNFATNVAYFGQYFDELITEDKINNFVQFIEQNKAKVCL